MTPQPNLTNPDELSALARDILESFSSGVRAKIETTRHIGELTLTHQKWQMNLADAKRLVAIVSYQPPSGTFAASYKAFPQSRYPELAEMEDVDDIARFLHLGDYISARLLPDSVQRTNTRQEADNQVHFWAREWASSLVQDEIDNLKPSFKTAQRRMTMAYEKLFELEHTLRNFIDMPLSQHYKTKKWLLLAYKDAAYQNTIRMRKQERRHSWLDNLENSEARFLDFDHIRQLIHANNPLFQPLVPDVPRLKRLLEDLGDLRNRIAHVNTISADDYQDFVRLANRVLAVISPKST